MSDFGWLSGIGGIAGAIGGWINNNNNIDAQMQMMRAQMAFNEAEARKNREWQEKMRETSYQTGMTDMKKAGLNPLLASNIGGAAMPTSAPASASALSVPAQRNYIAEGVASAVSLLQALNNADLVEAQVKKTEAETKLTTEQILSAPHQRDLTIADIERVKGSTFTPEERRRMAEAGIALQHAQEGAAGASSAASLAQAGKARTETRTEEIRQEHYRRWNAFPNVDQGARIGPVTLPPAAQMGAGNRETIGRSWDRNTVNSGSALDAVDHSRLTGAPPVSQRLRNGLDSVVQRMLRNFGRREVDQHGVDPYSTPNPYGQY